MSPWNTLYHAGKQISYLYVFINEIFRISCNSCQFIHEQSPLSVGNNLKFLFWQLAFPDAIYLVDAIQGGEMLVKACKPALESSYITKVIHDCKRDSEVHN